MEILIIVGVLVIGAAIATRGESDRPVIRRRRGLEMKARNGRLVHVRETESEHEL